VIHLLKGVPLVNIQESYLDSRAEQLASTGQSGRINTLKRVIEAAHYPGAQLK
jgi:hypothetical protein